MSLGERRQAYLPEQRQSAWGRFLYCYGAYACIVVAGSLANLNLRTMGAVTFVILLSIASVRDLARVRIGRLHLLVVGALFLPLSGPFFPGFALEVSGPYIVKYLGLCLVLLITLSLPLGPLPQSPRRCHFLALILFVLGAGLFYGAGDGVSEDRFSGVFVNPNNLALMSFCPLFLIEPGRDLPWKIFCAHIFTFVLLLASGTAGSLLGYLAVLGGHLAGASLRVKAAAYAAALAALIALLAGVVNSERTSLQQIINKAAVVQDHWSDDSVRALARIESEYGSGSSSAVWRLMLWRQAAVILAGGDSLQLLFGRGIGSSLPTLGIVPHNDYLRFLLETGAAGFLLHALIWIGIVKTIPRRMRSPLFGVALYSLTENNFDNFLALSFIASAAVGASQACLYKPPAFSTAVFPLQPVVENLRDPHAVVNP